MGDHDCCSAFGSSGDSLSDIAFGVGIQLRCRFIEKQDFRITYESSSDSEALTLAS